MQKIKNFKKKEYVSQYPVPENPSFMGYSSKYE
jgi:hypothetical protein